MRQIGQKGIKLNLGDRVKYKSKSMIHPDAIYEGEVIGCYKYFYEVLGAPIVETLDEKINGIYGGPIPYKFCIPKYLDSTRERVAVIRNVTVGELVSQMEDI